MTDSQEATLYCAFWYVLGNGTAIYEPVIVEIERNIKALSTKTVYGFIKEIGAMDRANRLGDDTEADRWRECQVKLGQEYVSRPK